MAFSIQEILDKPHVADAMRLMLDLHPFLAFPQLTNLWQSSQTRREASWRVYTGEISPDKLGAVEAARARDEVRLLQREGMLVSGSIKMSWPVPSKTRADVPFSTQVGQIVARNEQWSYGRRTPLRIFAPSEKLAGHFATDYIKPHLLLIHREVAKPRIEFIAPRLFLADWAIWNRTGGTPFVQIRCALDPHPNAPHGLKEVERGDGTREFSMPVYVPISKSETELNRLREIAAKNHPDRPFEFL